MAYNYYPNNQFYMQDLQNMRDRIENQMRQIQQQNQQPIQQPITQNFQLAPQSNFNELQSGYANNIDEVKNIFMTKNGIFVNKDLSCLWYKNTEGKIKTFTLIEVIEKDEKDIEIENLKKQLEEAKNLILKSKVVQEDIKKKSKKEEE